MAFAKACKILAGQPSLRFPRIAPFSLSTISSRKKSARELRQGGSNYRCCIPALAGFVSPQSIAPDGNKLFAKDGRCAMGFSRSGDLQSPFLVGMARCAVRACPEAPESHSRTPQRDA